MFLSRIPSFFEQKLLFSRLKLIISCFSHMIELSMVCSYTMDLLHIWSEMGACSPYFCTRFPALPALQNRREGTPWMSLQYKTGPRSIVDLIFHRDSLKFELSSGFSSANLPMILHRVSFINYGR